MLSLTVHIDLLLVLFSLFHLLAIIHLFTHGIHLVPLDLRLFLLLTIRLLSHSFIVLLIVHWHGSIILHVHLVILLLLEHHELLLLGFV